MKPAAPESPVKVKSLFHWDEAKREIRFAGDKVLKLAEDDERCESGDGRHLVIYQKCPSGGGKEPRPRSRCESSTAKPGRSTPPR